MFQYLRVGNCEEWTFLFVSDKSWQFWEKSLVAFQTVVCFKLVIVVHKTVFNNVTAAMTTVCLQTNQSQYGMNDSEFTQPTPTNYKPPYILRNGGVHTLYYGLYYSIYSALKKRSGQCVCYWSVMLNSFRQWCDYSFVTGVPEKCDWTYSIQLEVMHLDQC